MKKVSFDDAARSLASLMDEVCKEGQPTVIARDNGEDVVMMSLREFSSIEETLYVLGTPENAARLIESVLEIKQGKAQPRELIRDEEQEGGEQAASHGSGSLVGR